MGRRPGCVDGVRRKTESGNVLIVLLGAVFVLAILESAVFEIGDAARERALKLEDRDRAMGGIEFGMEALRQTVARELREIRICPICGAKFSAADDREFCPVCMLRQGLAGGVESGESFALEDTVKPTLSEHVLQRFEHYQLVTGEDGKPVELGRGAMGVTYKAFDINLRCPVTLKVISER